MIGPQEVLKVSLCTSAPRVASKLIDPLSDPTDVDLLKISSLVSLDVGGLAHTSVSNEHALELGTSSVLSLKTGNEPMFHNDPSQSTPAIFAHASYVP